MIKIDDLTVEQKAFLQALKMGEENLCLAICKAHTPKISELLKLEPNMSSSSIIFRALWSRMEQLVVELINIDFKNRIVTSGQNLLHYAIAMNQVQLSLKLINYEETIDLNCKDKDGLDVLLTACLAGNKDLVKTMVEEKKLNINTIDNIGNNLLFFSILSSNINCVEYVLSLKKWDINYTNKLGKDTFSVIESINDVKSKTYIKELLKSYCEKDILESIILKNDSNTEKVNESL